MVVIRKYCLIVTCTFLLCINAFVGHSYAENIEEIEDTSHKTNLQDKYYRQSLFHYFQGDSTQALTVLAQTKIKLNQLDARSSLFEAGLQLSEGMLQQAKVTLVNFNDILQRDEQQQINAKKSTKASTLQLIALLSLTDQYLLQGAITQAQETLNQIKRVPPNYYPQYHILSQLAFWPNTPKLLPVENSDEIEISSPYIKLNQALRQIEQQEFEQASNSLTQIKTGHWRQQEHGFWKTLFINETAFDSDKEAQRIAQKQSEAVQDYAQLLLSQIYISEQRYHLAFEELKNFPELSPYADSALFLFAFASQQVQEFSIAYNLLNILFTQSPYTSLAWQSAELMAQQVSEQQSHEQGIYVYENNVSFFLTLQQDLATFKQEFANSGDLLQFSKSEDDALLNTEILINHYQPVSPWLQQALYDVELANLYQQLFALDAQSEKITGLLKKTQWFSEIIQLNQTRKDNINQAKETKNYKQLFKTLVMQRDKLSAILAERVSSQDIRAFAEPDEKQWLGRIDNANRALQNIGTQKNTQEYQERLKRVEGVLSWQLSQLYPQRAWQQQKQLHLLDQSIAQAKVQQAKVDAVSKSDAQLNAQINKHTQSIEQLNALLQDTAKLRARVSNKIRLLVNTYIDDQSVVLAEHLLSTRQSMAKLLEQMASDDRKLASKLTAQRPVSSPAAVNVEQGESMFKGRRDE